MNKDKLRSLCQKLSKETGLSFNSIQTHYFLESILEKISISDESNNFIFKGGFLLSNVIGIRQRSTVDIDFLIRKFTLTEENIKQRFEKILSSGYDNGITYTIQKIEEIRKEDEYGGFRITVLCRLENIRQIIPLDIATGDPITPSDISYNYAEKIHTVYYRGIFNSRSKDFYDIYILYRLKSEKINYDMLRNACQNTFKYRSTDFIIDSIINLISKLKSEKDIRIRWKNYQRRFRYAEEISFDEVIDTVIEMVEKIK